jgi:hypothetical protein
MRHFLFLFSLIILINSCGIQKQTENSKKFCKEIAYTAKRDSLFTKQEAKQIKKYCNKGNVNEKYTQEQVEKFEDYLNEFSGEKQLKDLTYDTTTTSNIKNIEINEMQLEKYVISEKSILKNKKFKIVDKTDSKSNVKQNNSSNNFSQGTIAYSIPQEMKVGKSYQIKLRITKQKGKEINKLLVVGEREINIADTSVDSKITIENIRVEKSMTAELISEDGAFKITKLNTDKQIIEDDSYTEWGWIITPNKSGKTYLKLIIKIKIQSDGETSYKDIVVFDKDVEVKTNVKYEVKGWFEKYWQWLMTTIIIPIVIYFYKKRENRKKENNQN